ncbi:hypothetical protein NTGM5_120053 [Candidatus Nitrotoga sp. M5]|nr:hypothetical protein NTGM5_120053 [Candidatus Nitrotoga sp. M5]
MNLYRAASDGQATVINLPKDRNGLLRYSDEFKSVTSRGQSLLGIDANS